jgi:beta-lactamase regulating signal transducer with metallopeptidase domain
MNDLGWTMAWLAVQIAILLVPALGLHALASRRGPAPGAWVATLSLGMVVLLVGLAFVPNLRLMAERPQAPASRREMDRPTGPSKPAETGAFEVHDRKSPSAGLGHALEGYKLAWGRFERRAAGPVARLKPWGKAVAVAWLAGSAVGLLRLLLGLFAIAICRSRGRSVDDPAMVGLVEELRVQMGGGRGVALREMPDLATPATAGWLRPMLLLPGNWRGWDESERRAVVAHELAHVIRGDYAAGLLARVAVILNSYHPLVRWMAGRLQLQQELAADSMGARFAGGRSSYLLALSRLALEQDGRPSSWPARAFLPSRGTLIRRIAMLKDENESTMTGQAWSRARRLVTALGLLALTVGVASWRAPAQAQDSKLGTIDVSTGVVRRSSIDPAVAAPFEMRYIPDTMNGVVGFRPAATVQRSGMGMTTTLLRKAYGDVFAALAKQLKVDTSRPGFVKLRCEDVESVTCGLKISRFVENDSKYRDPKFKGEKPTGRLEFSGFTARAVAPFDWLGFCRQWTLELEQVREGRGVYYKIKGPIEFAAPFLYCVYLPDDRTIVINEVKWIKELIARESPTGPAYIHGKDWDRVSRDLLAVALNNQDDAFSKDWDPDYKKVPSFIKGVDRLVIGLADLDALTARGEVTARDPSAAEPLERSIQLFATLGLAQLAIATAEKKEFEPLVRLAKGFLSNVRVAHESRTVTASSEGFGTFAELGAFFKAMVEEVDFFGVASEKPKAEEAKAGPKAEKR